MHGHWWLPNVSNRKIEGTLSFDPQSSGTLKIRGNLIDNQLDPGEITILGDCEGVRVTLLFAQMGHSNIKMVSSGTYFYQEYITNLILIGIHTEDHESARFSQFQIETSLLNSWVPRSKYDFLDSETEFQIKIPKEDAISLFNSEQTSIEIKYPNLYRRSSTELVLHNAPYLITTHSIPLTISELHTSLLTPLLDFFTLANAKADNLLSLVGQIESPLPDQDFTEVKIYSSYRMASSPEFTSKPYQRWIPAQANLPEISQYVEKWLTFHAEFSTRFQEYFASKYRTDMYLEEKFFLLAKTVESWTETSDLGKNLLGNEQNSPNAIILEKIREVLSNEEFRKVESRLRVRETFKNSLNRIIHSQYEGIRNYLPDWDPFLSRLVNTRNKYAHPSPKKELLSSSEMFLAMNLLDLIIIHEILGLLGIPEKEINRITELSSQLQVMRQFRISIEPQTHEK